MAYLLLLQYKWSVKPWPSKYVKGDTKWAHYKLTLQLRQVLD